MRHATLSHALARSHRSPRYCCCFNYHHRHASALPRSTMCVPTLSRYFVGWYQNQTSSSTGIKSSNHPQSVECNCSARSLSPVASNQLSRHPAACRAFDALATEIGVTNEQGITDIRSRRTILCPVQPPTERLVAGTTEAGLAQNSKESRRRLSQSGSPGAKPQPSYVLPLRRRVSRNPRRRF